MQKKNTTFYLVYRRIGLILLILTVVIFILGSGCPPKPPPAPAPYSTSGDPSTQLLPDRSIAVLRDSLYKIGQHEYLDSTPELTINNKTMQSVTIQLSGSGMYNLTLDPRSSRTWRVKQGSYTCQLSIPGFPPTAGSGLTLENNARYNWDIWRNIP